MPISNLKNKRPHYNKFHLQRQLKVVVDALKVVVNVTHDHNVIVNSGCVIAFALLLFDFLERYFVDANTIPSIVVPNGDSSCRK
jgi:hypothetical protein